MEVEAEGGTQGGSADKGEEELTFQSIVSREIRVKLALATKEDKILASARTLADEVSEGYHWTQGLLFRTRLDLLGDNIK